MYINQFIRLAGRVKTAFVLLLAVILQIPLHIVYLFSGLYPRNSKIWLFGCWEGEKYRSNCKWLFEYVRENYPAIHSSWITKNIKLYWELKKKNVDVYYAYSLKGFIISFRAKYYFVSHGIRDMNEFASRKSVLIHLSHSIYPIKDMRETANNMLFIKTVNFLRNPYWYLVKPDYAVTASDFTAKATKHQFQINDDKIMITGLPKTDFLISANLDDPDRFIDKSYSDFYTTDNVRILYLPTFRSARSFSIFNFGFDPEKLDSLLAEINAVMAFSLHPSTSGNNSLKLPDLNKYKSISFFNFKGDEINRLLKKTSLFITDYSALFYDFLIYNKPVIFANFDHAGYLKERKLYVDYDSDLPGPKAENWTELLHHLQEVLYHKNDTYQKKREELRDLIYPTPDGKARERIAQHVLSLPA
jgi:CDP-glycerol glycerophosphotransferase